MPPGRILFYHRGRTDKNKWKKVKDLIIDNHQLNICAPFWHLICILFSLLIPYQLFIVFMHKSVACAGFILAGADIFFRGCRKIIRGGQTRARRARKNCLPPLFFFCPPGRIQFCPCGRTDKRGGGKPYYT